MRNKFDKQLVELNKEMTHMGVMIEESISRAINALIKQDTVQAKEIMDADIEIDREQKRIESICFNLLIQQQPVARDLRTITAAMKMVTDMERIGDHAADISEMTLLISKSGSYADIGQLNKMASETVYMLNKSIEAYVKKNEETAREVIAHDDIVDDLFEKAKQNIIDHIVEKKGKAEEVIDLFLVAKYFERIGDHATNIAEWVLYSLNTQQTDDIV